MYGHAEEVERLENEKAELKGQAAEANKRVESIRQTLDEVLLREISLIKENASLKDDVSTLQARLDKVEGAFHELLNDYKSSAMAVTEGVKLDSIRTLHIKSIEIGFINHWMQKAGLSGKEWNQHSAPQINPDNS